MRSARHRPNDIPWLQVTQGQHRRARGVFGNVAFIQRIDTRGGVAPTTLHRAHVAVDYSTNYVFWAPK